MLMFKFAELTVEKGFDWFLVTEREGTEKRDVDSGRVKHASTALVKMLHGKKPEGQGYDARIVVTTMAGSIKK